MRITDPYVYSGSNILKNKFHLHDQKKLAEAEGTIVSLAAISLRKNGMEINSIQDALKIHRTLFDGIYEWAGKIRTIEIYKSEPILDGKSIDYVLPGYINQALADLDSEFQKVDFSFLNPKEKVGKIAYFVSEFWHIHPFREGNTRTSALLLYFLVKKAGLHMDSSFLGKRAKYFRNALVLSCLYSQSKSEYLFGLVADSASMKDLSSGNYETIDGYEVKKYAYSNHTTEELKTIKDWRK